MKYYLLILLIGIAEISFGQAPIDLEKITNIWEEGKIGQSGNVIKADVNREGWYRLGIYSDDTVKFWEPLSCGFGYQRLGTWTLSQTDTVITFFFTKRFRYMNKPDTVDINITESYKIKLLTTDNLILTNLVGQTEKIWPFLRIEK